MSIRIEIDGDADQLAQLQQLTVKFRRPAKAKSPEKSGAKEEKRAVIKVDLVDNDINSEMVQICNRFRPIETFESLSFPPASESEQKSAQLAMMPKRKATPWPSPSASAEDLNVQQGSSAGDGETPNSQAAKKVRIAEGVDHLVSNKVVKIQSAGMMSICTDVWPSGENLVDNNNDDESFAQVDQDDIDVIVNDWMIESEGESDEESEDEVDSEELVYQIGCGLEFSSDGVKRGLVDTPMSAYNYEWQSEGENKGETDEDEVDSDDGLVYQLGDGLMVDTPKSDYNYQWQEGWEHVAQGNQVDTDIVSLGESESDA